MVSPAQENVNTYTFNYISIILSDQQEKKHITRKGTVTINKQKNRNNYKENISLNNRQPLKNHVHRKEKKKKTT